MTKVKSGPQGISGKNVTVGQMHSSGGSQLVTARDTAKVQLMDNRASAHDSLDKRVKRGNESWNFIFVVLSVLLGLEFSIIQVLKLDSIKSTISILMCFLITSWLCLRNPWFQNKLIGVKIWLEDQWGKL